MHIKRFFLIFITFLLLVQPVKAATFIHPGLLNNKAELDFIKSQVNSGASPWKAGYDVMKNANNYLTHTPKAVVTIIANAYADGNDNRDTTIEVDAEVSYGSALMWYITGDTRYAETARKIFNAWADKFNNCTGSDCKLVMGYEWPPMVWAAEIIRYSYSGWTAAEITKFETMLETKVWNYIQGGSNIRCNWPASIVKNLMSIAVFLDDKAKFDHAVQMFSPTLTRCIEASGKAEETCRDFWHTQRGIEPLVMAAEIAWKQGVDLYSLNNNRLLTGLEFHAPYLLGAPAPSNLCGGTIDDMRHWSFYEVTYNHYHNRKGLEAPGTWKLIQKYRPEDFRWVGWGTLTHAQLPTGGPIPSYSPTPSVVPSTSPTAKPTPQASTTPLPSSSLGDADGNGLVNAADFKIWVTNYLKTGGKSLGNFNSEIKINLVDFAIWRFDFLH